MGAVLGTCFSSYNHENEYLNVSLQLSLPVLVMCDEVAHSGTVIKRTNKRFLAKCVVMG
jgi:hypothetical protein